VNQIRYEPVRGGRVFDTEEILGTLGHQADVMTNNAVAGTYPVRDDGEGHG
jgi:hypothetical protein